MDHLSRIPRHEKLPIARRLQHRLAKRKAEGPPEPALDMYEDEIAEIADRLEAHVSGKTLASAARTTRAAHLDACDDEVDTWFRTIEGFVNVAAHRRTGPNIETALALWKSAFPDGRAHLDDPVPEQNKHCRASLKALRSEEHAATIAALGMPAGWIDAFEASLKASEEAHQEVVDARTETHMHVELGCDVEADWVDVMRRLRLQVASRSRKGGVAMAAEGRELLEPLLTALQKRRADHAARATRRAKKTER